MYNKLLLSAGGGIISNEQQAEQNPAATVCIGLGGTGISCLTALKQEVYDRLRPDNIEGVPVYSHIKFLAIDSDKLNSDRDKISAIDENTEFINIGCSDIHALLKSPVIVQNKPYLKWLKASSTEGDSGAGIAIKSAEAGAGGVRQIGRLLLFQNCDKFINKFTNLITEAQKELPSTAELNIHIFTGMGGGTGAGIFLDVCYIIQYILDSLNLAGRAQTCGYFFLPDVNLDRIADPNIKEYIMSNGYASMKELNYCMSYEYNGDCWDEEYPGFHYKTSQPPVKLAHLITAKNAEGAISRRAYDYAMHVAADYVMDFLIKPENNTSENDSVFTMKSHISNIENLRQMVTKEHGASYDYCVLGASNTYLPYKEITTYLTSKLFESFRYIKDITPSKSDIEIILKNLGLDYEGIMKSLNEKVPSVPFYEVDKVTLFNQTRSIGPEVIPPVLMRMHDACPGISEKYAENKKNLLADYDTYSAEGSRSAVSLIARLDAKLKELAERADKGPYYSAEILSSVENTDLKNVIDGYIDRNNKNIANARADFAMRDRAVASALGELQYSNAFNRTRRAEYYIEAVNALFRQKEKVEMFTVLGDVLAEFKVRVENLYVSRYAIFIKVFDNLMQTFSANLSELSVPQSTDNGYSRRLLEVKDLKNSLDSAVKKMKTDDIVSRFTGFMLTYPELWIAQDEQKIACAVSVFFIDVLHEFTSMTMIDYLKIKFSTDDPNVIKSRVYSDIIMPISHRADPLYWCDGSKFNLDNAGKLGFCTVPQISQEIKAAADDYHRANANISVRPSYISDRISFLNFLCGVPLYSYNGVGIYKNAERVTGAYLHEGAKNDGRDWRRLPDIIPFSCVSDPSDMLKQRAQIYDRAFAEGIVAKRMLNDQGDTDYVICECDRDFISSALTDMREALKSGDIVKLSDAVGKYKNKKVPVNIIRSLKKTGSAGFRDAAVKDTVICAGVIMDIIKKALDEKTEYLDTLSECIRVSDRVNAGNSDFTAFAGALFTGTLKQGANPYEYIFEKEVFGIKNKTVITDIDKAPFGEHLPLFSAYKGFTELPPEIKEEIIARTRERKLNNADEVSAIKAEIKKKCTDEMFKAMMERANLTFPQDFAEIGAFTEKFAQEIKML